MYPININQVQWEKLVKYWINEKTIIKAFTVNEARENQKQMSKYEQGGKLLLRRKW
jgi:hypothetical protein